MCIRDRDQLWPVRKQSAVWRAHHAFGAWCEGEPGSWLYPDTAERFFGKATSIEQLVAQLQLLQAQGYKAIYEEARRQKPFCSAVACWVFNEPWPAAANNSLVAWPNHPKPAYFAVKEANRPVMLSARIPRFDWARGATLTVTLFLLNDLPIDIPVMQVRVSLVSGSGEVLEVYKWKCPGAHAGRHSAGPEVSARVPNWDGLTFELVLDVVEHPDYSSRYTLAFQKR
jgi:beta-mannosidase